MDKGKPSGPDRKTTIIGENIHFKVAALSKAGHLEAFMLNTQLIVPLLKAEPAEAAEVGPKLVTGKGVICRLCKGGHFTAFCPYKDQLAAIDNVEGDEIDDGPGGPESGGGPPGRGAPGTQTRYIPP